MVPDDPEVFVDRYEILALLGRGSMGNVYKVRDRELDEVVALKCLKEQFADHEAAIDQFRREVKMARRVTHRNVARTFDIGSADRGPYLTMEFIEGDSLDRLLREQGPLGAPEFLGYVEPICRALEAAHEVGVVHRDLKPQNVMVTESGRLVVTDFGIARPVAVQDEQAEDFHSGTIGTPGYMAPEQVEQRPDVDHRADIYALGIIMYRMLTGELPWDGKNAAAVAFARCVQPAPELPSEGHWPASFRYTVRSCLQRDRIDRFQSASEVLEALHREPDPDYSTYAPPEQTGPAPGEHHEASESAAVLPLGYQGPDKREYLAEGVTDELIDGLSRAEGVAVLPRGAVARFEESGIDPRQVGEQLEVDVVIEGTVRQFDDTLRVRVAATSVDEGFQLWGETFEAEPTDLLEVGQRAARAAAESMTADSGTAARSVPSDPAAVDLYMRALHAMKEGWYTDLDEALALFEKALDRSAEDPRILSGLATAQARASFLDHPNRETHVARAADTARRAMRIAPDWPEPQVALAMARYNAVDFREALDALDRALDLAPEYFEAHELRGRIVAEVGSLEEAIDHLERTLEFNPFRHNARWDLARAYALRGNWEQAEAWMERPVDSESARILRFAHQTRLDVWREEPRWLDQPPEPAAPDGSIYREVPKIQRSVMRTGELTEAHKQQLDDLLSHHGDDSRYLSMLYQLRLETGARAGDVDYALDQLERAVQVGLVDINWLTYCPVLDALEGHRQFREARATIERRVETIADD
jgi:serine/threonine-protein kinase